MKGSNKKTKNLSFKSNLETLGRVLASPNKQKILYIITYPKTPKQVSKDTNLNFPTTSKTIKELEELKLVVINNKNLRKGKIITISKKGQDIVEDLKSKESVCLK